MQMTQSKEETFIREALLKITPTVLHEELDVLVPKEPL